MTEFEKPYTFPKPNHFEEIHEQTSTGKEFASDPLHNRDIESAIPENDGVEFPNRWARIRYQFREPLAEFLGVMVLVLFGCGGNAQGTLFDSTSVSASPAGGWMAVALGWGIGLGLGGWISGNVSGGHINPAVTISLATFRGFPWRKVPIYILAQLFGGIIGAAVVYANYFAAINAFEGGRGVRTLSTAGIFGTLAADYLDNASVFFDEYIGAFLLMFVILIATDPRASPHPMLVPIALFFALFGLGIAFGAQTGFAVNPARDLGPRILSAIVGYGRAVFNFRHQYWLWGGVLAPILGMLSATFVYDMLIYTGEDSIINRPNKATRSRRIKLGETKRSLGHKRDMSEATAVHA